MGEPVPLQKERDAQDDADEQDEREAVRDGDAPRVAPVEHDDEPCRAGDLERRAPEVRDARVERDRRAAEEDVAHRLHHGHHRAEAEPEPQAEQTLFAFEPAPGRIAAGVPASGRRRRSRPGPLRAAGILVVRARPAVRPGREGKGGGKQGQDRPHHRRDPRADLVRAQDVRQGIGGEQAHHHAARQAHHVAYRAEPSIPCQVQPGEPRPDADRRQVDEDPGHPGGEEGAQGAEEAGGGGDRPDREEEPPAARDEVPQVAPQGRRQREQERRRQRHPAQVEKGLAVGDGVGQGYAEDRPCLGERKAQHVGPGDRREDAPQPPAPRDLVDDGGPPVVQAPPAL